MKSPLIERKKINNFRTTKKLLAVSVFCLLFLPFGGFAKSLAEYHTSVSSAKDSIGELIDYVDDVIAQSDSKDLDYELKILADIRKDLPVTEKIEWEGTSVDSGNQWLESSLKNFEESEDWTKRRLILTEIRERLSALEAKIKQLENPVVSDRSKDEDKRKLAEILRRPEYQKTPPQEESWFQKLRKRFQAWLDEKFPRPPPLPEGSSAGMQSLSIGLQVLLYAVLFGLIAFLLYRFVPFLAGKFRRRKRQEKSERVILGEKLSADEDAQTLFDEAEALARSGNLRGAIRKGYIALLCELSDRKIIGLAQHKTNRDYLRDVRKKQALYQNMNGLTLSFERHWYGFDDADENDWNEFKQTYQKAVRSEN